MLPEGLEGVGEDRRGSAATTSSCFKGVITDSNDEQFARVTAKIEAAVGGSVAGRTVGVWGLTFKARTDDLRDSPALEIVGRLLARGAKVLAYDPSEPSADDPRLAGIELTADPYAAVAGAEVLAVLTEWDELRWLDFDKVADVMAGRHVVDARNLLDRTSLQRRGFTYTGIGRS